MTFKKFISTIFLFFLSFSSTSQISADKDIRLETGCGNSGQTSDEIFIIYKLIADKKLDELILLTHSDNQKLKLLSIIALDNSNSADKNIIQTLESDEIKKYKRSQDAVYICSDCGGHEKTTIRKLFKKEKNSYRKSLDNELKPRQ